MTLVCTFAASALAQPTALRTAFDAWWDAAAVDTLDSPPTLVRLVRRAQSDLHKVALRCDDIRDDSRFRAGSSLLRCALDPIAHVALRRAARRAAGVCLIYEQEMADATEDEVAVELLEGRP